MKNENIKTSIFNLRARNKMDEMQYSQKKARRLTPGKPHKTTTQVTKQFAILLRALNRIHLVSALLMMMISQITFSDVLMINVNRNDSEIKVIQKHLDQKCKSTRVCEKLHVIPQPESESVILNDMVFLRDFDKIIRDLPENSKIKSIIVSGHHGNDGGSHYSGDKNNPKSRGNMVSSAVISQLFSSLNPNQKYLSHMESGKWKEDRSRTRIEDMQKKVTPESLFLLGCYSTQNDQIVKEWLMSSPNLQCVLGSSEVYPLGESARGQKLLTDGLRTCDSHIRSNKSNQPSPAYEMTSAVLSKSVSKNHDVMLFARDTKSESINDWYLFHAHWSKERLKGEPVIQTTSVDRLVRPQVQVKSDLDGREIPSVQ